MRVLITGASGFIGPHLAAALVSRGHEVKCLVRSTSRTARLNGLGVALTYGDVLDPASLASAIQGADVVFHLAALVKALKPADLFRVNEQGTTNVARACAEQGHPPVLVLVSSIAAAGPAIEGRVRNETDAASPVSNYGRSKRASELAAARFADRLPLTIVRPSIVFGEGDQDMLSMFLAIKRTRLNFQPGYAERRLSMLHAADVAPALIAAAERGSRLKSFDDAAAQGYYFLAAEFDPTFGEWGNLIARALGRRRVLTVRMPEALGWGIAACSEAWSRVRRRANILSFDKIREATAGSWVCSAARARDELGFDVAAPLEDRFAQTADWYARQGWI